MLAHIGVLGLSLPYMLTLMQPSGDRDSLSSVVPIELVADPADQSSAERAAELAESQEESSAAKAASEADARAADSAASPSPSTESGLSEPPESPPAMSTYTRSQTEPQEIANNSPSPNSPAAGSTRPNDPTSASSSASQNSPASNPSGSTSQNSPASNPSGSTNENSSTSAAPGATSANNPTATSSDPEASTGDNSAESADGGSDGTSVINGTGPLPAPETASNGTSSEQVAYLSILGSSEVPKGLQQDVFHSSPKLISNTTDVAAIEWRPQDLNCERVDFSQPTGTYKIAVNADGTMSQATLWTEGVERATSESEGAIACLLESADLQFEPAQLDGQPVFNDNLLLTVEIIEAQPN